MFQSYKNRFIVVTLLLVLFVPIAWKLAVKKTWECYRENRQLAERLKVAENAAVTLPALEAQLEQWNQTMVVDTLRGDVQNRLLNDISNLCHQNHLLLRQMPATQKTVDNSYQVETLNVQVAGTFHQLLKLLNQVEDPERSFNIVSASFILKEARGDQPEQLILNLYLQAIKEINHEE